MPSDGLREARQSLISRITELEMELHDAIVELAAHPDVPAMGGDDLKRLYYQALDEEVVKKRDFSSSASARHWARMAELLSDYRVTASGDSARLAEADAMELALQNIYMYARRQKKNAVGDDVHTHWAFVIQHCEKAGLRSSILRNEPSAPAVAEARQECGKPYEAIGKDDYIYPECRRDAGHEGTCGRPRELCGVISGGFGPCEKPKGHDGLHQCQIDELPTEDPPAALDALRRNLVQLLKCFPLQTKRAAMGLPSDQDEDYTYGLIADAILAAAKQER